MLRNSLLQLAHEIPELRKYCISLIREASNTSSTIEGAVKLFEAYRNRLQTGKTSLSWKDFYKPKLNFQKAPQLVKTQFEFLPANEETLRAWGDQWNQEKATPEQREACSEYTGYANGPINYCLRNKLLLEPRDKRTQKNLEALIQASKVPEDIKVLRFVGNTHPIHYLFLKNELKPDMEISDKGFMSTSILQSWRNHSFLGLKLHIDIPKGSSAMYLGPTSKNSKGLSETPQEFELLLNRGGTLKVLDIDRENKTVHCVLVD